MKILWNVNIRRLVKAEITYNLFSHAILFLTLTLSFYLFGRLASNNLYKDPSLPHILAVAIMYLLFTTRFTEKRMRLFQILPLRQDERALALLYAQVLYWLGAMIIYTISILAYFPDSFLSDGIWRLFALNALLIASNAAFCLSFDLWAGSRLPNFVKAMLLVFVWIIILKMSAVYFEGATADFMPKADIALILFLYKTPIGVLLQHIVALLFSFASLKLYLQRQTFLN